MKKYLSLMAVLSVTAMTFSAHADVKKPTLVCNFTEPFIQIIVLAKGQQVGAVGDTVAYRAPGEDAVVGAVSAVTVKDGVTSLKLSGSGLGQYILDVVFGKKGSDGMSDKEYQSEGILKTADGVQVLYGGCDTVL